jgi:hypothetical protein
MDYLSCLLDTLVSVTNKNDAHCLTEPFLKIAFRYAFLTLAIRNVCEYSEYVNRRF